MESGGYIGAKSPFIVDFWLDAPESAD